MVLFFKSTGKSRSDAKKRMSYRHNFLVVDPPAVIYMGKDKVESMEISSCIIICNETYQAVYEYR